MSKHALAALAGAAVLTCQGAHAHAQQTQPPAAQGQAAPVADGKPTLPPVVVEQKPAAAVTAPPAAKPKPAPAAAEADPPPPPKPKRAAAKPAPKPQPAPATAPVAAPAVETVSPATALGTYNPALDLPKNFKIPPGTTLTTAGPVYGYQALSAMSSTKTATPIEQIPQSIQVVPKSLMKDQSTTTIGEALQNVSNVQGLDPRNLGLDSINIGVHKVRGFAAEQWLDGLMVVNNAGDLSAFANVERIEVLKGPSAILYGGGVGAPIGGAVNVVSKLPTDKPSAEAGVKFGSHDFVQPYFDINQPLSPNVLFRITAEYTSSKDYVDILDQDRYSINPTLTLTNKTDTSLTVQGRVSKVMQQTYHGLPAFGTITGNFRIDPHLFIGPSDIERGFSQVKSITVSLDHKFDDYWSGNVKARWSKSSSDQRAQILQSADATGATPQFPPSTWLLANSEFYLEQEDKTIAANLQAKFNFGESRNILLVGGDYARAHNSGHFNADYLGNAGCLFFADCTPTFFGTPPLVSVDLRAPSFSTPFRIPTLAGQTIDTTSTTAAFFGPVGQYFAFSDMKDAYTTQGAYVQAQSTLYERVHLLAGVRLANIKTEHIETTVRPDPTISDTTKALPRAGIVVDVLPWLSPYASYSEGMKAVSSLNLKEAPKPEETVQKEAGVKLHFNNQLSGTIAVFEIERNNIPVTSNLVVTTLSDQISRGYEADLIWQPNFNWQFLASYGHTGVAFAKAKGAIRAGAKVPGVPEDSGRVWVNYRFDQPMLMGLSVGAGVYLASGAYVDDQNLYKTAGYYTVDARIGYDTKDFSAAFNVKNLTGEEYFVPYTYLGGQVSPGDARAYYGTLAYRF
jgi:iron complex outermembrane receptor protein